MTDSQAGESGKPLGPLTRAVVEAAVMHAGIRLGPDAGAAVSALAMPYAEEITRRAVNEFREDAEQRVADMLGSAAEELGWDDPDQLADMIGMSERTRLLAITAMDGAVSASS